ncbi:MAG: FlgD immunoglobulin-like domain containing protein, partial [bacterium]
GGSPSTTIRFMLKTRSQVTLKIYNLLGNEIRTLLSAPLTPGSYQAQWDGRDNLSRPVASGIYIYRMTADGQVQSRRMLLTK